MSRKSTVPVFFLLQVANPGAVCKIFIVIGVVILSIIAVAFSCSPGTAWSCISSKVLGLVCPKLLETVGKSTLLASMWEVAVWRRP